MFVVVSPFELHGYCIWYIVCIACSFIQTYYHTRSVSSPHLYHLLLFQFFFVRLSCAAACLYISNTYRAHTINTIMAATSSSPSNNSGRRSSVPALPSPPPSSGNVKDEGEGGELNCFQYNLKLHICNTTLPHIAYCWRILYQFIFNISLFILSHPHINALRACINSLGMRYSQLMEEKNHKDVTDSNKKELLQKKLERLRALKDEIAQDEWMFEDNR